MSHRSIALTLLALVTPVIGFAGCSEDDDHHHRHGVRDDDDDVRFCSAYTTCGTCTPVRGCGWCETPDGRGTCASGPDQCRGDTFRWNWEPSGCPGAPADAGPTDAPASETASDAAADVVNDAPSEVAAEAGDAPPAACGIPSSGLSGCVPTSGGSLCKATHFTLGCHGSPTPAPDNALGCTKAASTADGTYYCCPCAP